MSDTAAYGHAARHGVGWPAGTGSHGGGATAAARWEPPDARRRLQLALAAAWLLDAVLQYQSVMFTRAFARMLAPATDGNPAVVAGPVTWSARIIEQHVVAANSVFATVQLLLARCSITMAWLPRSCSRSRWPSSRPASTCRPRPRGQPLHSRWSSRWRSG